MFKFVRELGLLEVGEPPVEGVVGAEANDVPEPGFDMGAFPGSLINLSLIRSKIGESVELLLLAGLPPIVFVKRLFMRAELLTTALAAPLPPLPPPPPADNPEEPEAPPRPPTPLTPSDSARLAIEPSGGDVEAELLPER